MPIGKSQHEELKQIAKQKLIDEFCKKFMVIELSENRRVNKEWSKRDIANFFGESYDEYIHYRWRVSPGGVYSLKKVQEKVMENTDFGKDSLLLELGCGTGISMLSFIDKCKVVGLELSSKLVVRGRDMVRAEGNFENASFICADAENLPFKNNIFDGTISFGVLEHLPDVEKSIEEQHRVVKKEGYITAQVPNAYSPYMFLIKKIIAKISNKKALKVPTHFKGLSPFYFRKVFRKVSFEQVKIYYTNLVYPEFRGKLLRVNIFLEEVVEKIPILSSFMPFFVIIGVKKNESQEGIK